MGDKKTTNSMQWTKRHDILLCREILVLEPYKHKKESNESGKIWTQIAQTLKSYQEIVFKPNLSQRGVRERFALLQSRYKAKERAELLASGISPEQDELDVLLEEITEREKSVEENKENDNQKKELDRVTANEMRQQAMETIGITKKRKIQEGLGEDEGVVKEKRKRRNGGDALEFVKEKCEREMALREKEIEINKQEQQSKASQFEAMFNQQQTILQTMQQQQAHQQQQSQNLYLIMAQQNKAMMSLLEKIAK